MKANLFILTISLLSILQTPSFGYSLQEECSFEGKKREKFQLEQGYDEDSELRVYLMKKKKADDDDYYAEREKELFTGQGLLKCYGYGDDDSELSAEIEIKSGFAHGKFREYRMEYVGDKNKHMVAKETYYKNGKESGVRTGFSKGKFASKDVIKNGKIVATAHYSEGKLSSLSCSEDSGSENEVDKLCGWDGLSKVKFHDYYGENKETKFYLKGKIVQTEYEDKKNTYSPKTITVMGKSSKHCKCDDKNSWGCQNSSVSYNQNGKLTSLSCGCVEAPSGDNEGPFYSDIRKLCGYEGLSNVSLYRNDKGTKPVLTYSLLNGVHHGDTKKFDWESGKLVSHYIFDKGQAIGEAKEYFEDGTLMRVVRYKKSNTESAKDDRLPPAQSTTLEDGDITTYNEQGKKLSEVVYEGNMKSFERTYYLNGNLKQETAYVREKNGGNNYYSKVTVLNKYYGDDGRLTMEESLKNNARDGLTRYYHDNGKIAVEANYRDGYLASQKYLSATGERLCSEEFETDGSRKSVAPGKKNTCPPEGWASVGSEKGKAKGKARVESADASVFDSYNTDAE